MKNDSMALTNLMALVTIKEATYQYVRPERGRMVCRWCGAQDNETCHKECIFPIVRKMRKLRQ